MTIVYLSYANDEGKITYYAVQLDWEALAELIKTSDRLQEETYERGPVPNDE